MKSVVLRSSVIAAVANLFVLGFGITNPVPAQAQRVAAAAANPELAARGEWHPATTYAAEDIVTARGSSWISLRDNNTNRVPGQTNPSSATFWQLFARGFNPTGAWVNSRKYQPDDLVTFNGQTFRAKITNNDSQPAPGQLWELFAAKGDPGPNTGIPRGTLDAPAISFDGDPSTGIYSPRSGKIAVVANGDLFLHNLGTNNTALGLYALKDNTTGANNVALGVFALHLSTTGGHNIAIGSNALAGNTTGSSNTAVGTRALGGVLPMTGVGNTAIGFQALLKNGGGDNNIAVGKNAAANPTFSNDSIFIGNPGIIDDSATIKIGTQGTQESAFIAGIRGVPTGEADAIPVLIDSTGQLGTVSSSRRYKTDIETMADVSAILGKLRPVTFRYKQAQNGGQHPLQYGLIAEEVANVFPDLAVLNKDGSAESVKYHLLPSFLLAGYQAQQQTIAAQAARDEGQQRMIEAQAEKIEAQAGELRRQQEVNATLEARLSRIEALLPAARAAALQ